MLYVFPLIWRDLGTLNEDLFSTYLKIFLPAAIIIYPSIRFFEKIKKVNIAINLGWFFLIVAFLTYILLPSNIYSFYSWNPFFSREFGFSIIVAKPIILKCLKRFKSNWKWSILHNEFSRSCSW